MNNTTLTISCKSITINYIDICWLAGLLEGEGSFISAPNRVNGKLYRYPGIALAMTDEDIVNRAAKLLGTTYCKVKSPVRKNPSFDAMVPKPMFRLMIIGSKAAGFMTELLPLMGIRRSAKIKEILDEWNNRETTDIKRKRACQVAVINRQRDDKGHFIKRIHAGQ